MEVWLTKLETHLESQSASQTRQLLEDRGYLAAGAYQGGLLLSQGEQRKAHYDHFKRRLDLCQSLSIPTLIVAADFVEKVDEAALQRAVVSPAPGCPVVRHSTSDSRWSFAERPRFVPASTPPWLWFRPAASRTSVSVSTSFTTTRGRASSTTCRCSPRKPWRSFRYAIWPAWSANWPATRTASFQEKAISVSNRSWPSFAIGYDGHVSLELFNPNLWKLKPAQVMALGYQSVERLLKQAPR